ncbi:hypothetical protein, partial [Mesorhizobium sp. M5C.F.Ca.ET.164.01.1.1]|uniref:hypothetical protein n=1 Tax=Mesorhizobium sp. M5C.F.Ca.ET.164.01.1.1 TaxID=2563957 RepID=UPI001AEE0414
RSSPIVGSSISAFDQLPGAAERSQESTQSSVDARMIQHPKAVARRIWVYTYAPVLFPARHA